MYLLLRERFFKIAADLLNRQRLQDSSWQPQEGTDEWKTIERYWWQCFDEWFTTKKLNTTDWGYLWDHYYATAIQAALNSDPMRRVLIGMLDK